MMHRRGPETKRRGAFRTAEQGSREPDLRHDLTSAEVAVETLRSGRTETASHSAAHLRGDAQGPPGTLRNENRFDGVVSTDVEEPLAREVRSDVVANHAGKRSAHLLGQPRAQARGKAAHRRKVDRTPLMHPLHQLAGAERLFTPAGEQGLEFPDALAEQISRGNETGISHELARCSRCKVRITPLGREFCRRLDRGSGGRRDRP